MMLYAAATALALALAGLNTLDPAASYPEGPLFVGDRLFVAEMGADTVFAHEGGEKRVFLKAPGCGPTSIAPYGAGYVVLCHVSARLLQVGADGAVEGEIRRTVDGRPLDDPNDSSADDAGGVYLSDPGRFSKSAPREGELLYLDASGRVRTLADGLWYPNGVFFDRAEGALYVSEHLARRILRFPVTGPGQLGPMQVFADLKTITAKKGAYREAGPDGLERAPNGDLVVALYGEGRLIRLDRKGLLVGETPLDTPYVTNVAFSADGRGVAVGAFDNASPPFPGAVFTLAPPQR